MTKRSLRRLMHLVLAATATDAAIACGGAVASVDPQGEQTPTTDPPSTGKKKPNTPSQDPDEPDVPKKPKPKQDPPDPPDPPDASIDTKPDTSNQSCITGQIDPDPKFCCADPNDPKCNNGGGGGDGDQCVLDCVAVCNAVAPGKDPFGWCSYTAAASPKISYYCGACGVGRIPAGTTTCDRGSSVGERLAMQAYYEAVSVLAFERLADVLEREGAPTALVDRARRAAIEEDRHAALFRSLAEQNGAIVREPSVENDATTLLDLACENAREGCVRETHGALVVLHQSRHAKAPEIREAFRSIADDEIAHAALSSDLATWFDGRLTLHEQAIVARARLDAARDLRHAMTKEHDPIDELLGMPSMEKGRALFDALQAGLEETKRPRKNLPS